MFDIIIKGGTVYDGTGRGGIRTDVGISGDSIVAVGDLGDREAAKIVDASGKSVAPGFIDTHSHSDLRLLVGEPPTLKLAQGITTEILGQDGLSVAPIVDKDIPLYQKMLQGLLGDHDLEWKWRSAAEYLDALAAKTLPLNVAYLVPHGPIRTAVMGMDNRHATDSEVNSMRPMLDRGLAEGGCGLSTGLIYPPCSFANSDELTELCKIAAKHDLPFVVHMRDEGYNIMSAVDEVLDIARRSGVHLHISHLKLFGRSVWDKADELLGKLARAREAGTKITADQYPYYAGSTVLTAVLPTWTLAGGTEALLARLKDPDIRVELKEWFAKDETAWTNRAYAVGWENVVVSWVKTEANKKFEGKSIMEIAEMRGQEPGDAACDLLIEEDLAVTQITFYGNEETIQPIMTDPWVMVCTDGIYGGKPHPRLYGAFPRVLGKYVRERGVLALPEAIRKMTSLPACTFKLPKKGVIAENYCADITVFDQDTIIDNATFDNPEQLATGVECVIVGGVIAVENGKHTGKTPGKVARP